MEFTNTILVGDVTEKIKLLPDKSVRCCVTSPPYYGLRDYGTASWIGGDESCDHKKVSEESVRNSRRTSTISYAENTGHSLDTVYANICGKCGAIRIDAQIGLEKTPEDYVQKMVEVFREVKRVLTDDGTLWLNIGDSYWGSGGTNGQQPEHTNLGKTKTDRYYATESTTGKKHDIIKPKDLIGIPWMLAFALRADDWYLRQDIIWHKPNPMPESVTDRCTKAHEYIFLLSKSAKYYFDADAIKTKAINPQDDLRRISQQSENNKSNPDELRNGLRPRKSGNIERKNGSDRGCPEDSGSNVCGSVPWEGMTANKKTVWTVTTKPFSEAHFATFPEDLIVDCIKAGTSEHGCCSQCGKPCVRVVESKKIPRNELPKEDPRYQPNRYTDNKYANELRNGYECGMYSESKTVGWQPTCQCNAAIIPDVILDPFMGAGTTALVAAKLNRNFVGIELNPEYVKILKKRLHNELGMFCDLKIIT